jgi:hypothetical protein
MKIFRIFHRTKCLFGWVQTTHQFEAMLSKVVYYFGDYLLMGERWDKNTCEKNKERGRGKQ